MRIIEEGGGMFKSFCDIKYNKYVVYGRFSGVTG
jgi:hypothetical protein